MAFSHHNHSVWRLSLAGRAVSHVAIAAALALSDVSAGERMVAFSLASFANREHRAWPGTRVAAARAGLSRSQYLAARDGLARRGLVVVEHAGGWAWELAGRRGDVRAGGPLVRRRDQRPAV